MSVAAQFPLVVLDREISFADGGGSTPFLMEGWSAQEALHRWTDGGWVRLGFRLANAGECDVLLRMKCRAFIPSEGLDHQRVEVRVNDVRVAIWTIREEAWHEAGIPARLLDREEVIVTFLIGRPASPLERGISSDARKLGLLVRQVNILKSPYVTIIDWIGAGADPVGNVLQKDGNYYRAIRKESLGIVRELEAAGAYRELASRGYIPDHAFSDLHHSEFAAVAMTPGAPWSIFPGHYVFSQLRDAARAWLGINEFLLDAVPGKQFGLIDGHYGNFAVFDNSRPRWVDSGSMLEIGPGRQFDGWFGMEQFVICFILPLLAFHHRPNAREHIRLMMGAYPDGFRLRSAESVIGSPLPRGVDLEPFKLLGQRREALSALRALVDSLDFQLPDTAWAHYRNPEALRVALRGGYHEPGQDPRFAAVVELVRRSSAKTFVDIGANDGLFSLMCAREGLSGIALDIDDVALNRLYDFLSDYPGVAVSVACLPFLFVEHPADIALALALTHHLVLSQRIDFETIARRLALNARKALVTEFMPDGLGGTPGYPEPSPNPLPEDYSLEKCMDALGKHFRVVEVVDYPRPNATSRRVMIYCEK